MTIEPGQTITVAMDQQQPYDVAILSILNVIIAPKKTKLSVWCRRTDAMATQAVILIPDKGHPELLTIMGNARILAYKEA